jgi:hypothetical protein
MRIYTLDIDYGAFMATTYDLLAVGDGLRHGHDAPAMSGGWRVAAILLVFTGGA